MCVIMFADEKRATPEMVEAAWKKNGHGGGVGARVKGSDSKNYVWWKKGLDLDAMQHYAATLELPHVLHFRISTSGGIIPELCHPFPVKFDTPYMTEGIESGSILFHNGSWNANWKVEVLNMVARHYDKGIVLPPGKWSDTRAMAFLSAFYGPNFMDFIEQKGIVFGPDDYEIFWGDGWTEVNGVLCSNDKFIDKKAFTSHNHAWTICREAHCSEEQGLLNGYCPKHRPPLAPPHTHAGLSNKMICDKCRALLGDGADHLESCPDKHMGTASPSVQPYNGTCPECNCVQGVGKGHSSNCSKLKNKQPDMGKPCHKCKEHITDPRDHKMDCPLFLKGGIPGDDAYRGGRYPTPFLLLMIAEQARRLGPLKGGISNNQMKRIKARLDMKHVNTKDMDIQHLMTPEERKVHDDKLKARWGKDPRVEVVTH